MESLTCAETSFTEIKVFAGRWVQYSSDEVNELMSQQLNDTGHWGQSRQYRYFVPNTVQTSLGYRGHVDTESGLLVCYVNCYIKISNTSAPLQIFLGVHQLMIFY